jgi:hypothetical protein
VIDPSPPRRNGELAFDEPWQSRAFAIAIAVTESQFGGDMEPFRQRLIAAVSKDQQRSYWASWAAALEQLVLDEGLVGRQELETAMLDAERSQP